MTEVLPGLIKLRVLRWGKSPGLCRWAQCDHKGLCERGVRASVREGEQKQGGGVEDAMIGVLYMKKGVINQGVWMVFKS